MPEIVFRVTALVLAIVYGVVRSVFVKRLNRPGSRAEMKRANRRDKLELYAISIGSVPLWLYMLTPFLDFAAMGLPMPVRWLGAALTAAAILLFAWSHATLAGNWSPFVEQPPTGTLITTGPYRYVRHPMYSSFFLYNVGMSLLCSNWLAGGAALFGFLFMYLSRAGREERLMLERFGDEYAEYAAKTGRVLPLVGRARLG